MKTFILSSLIALSSAVAIPAQSDSNAVASQTVSISYDKKFDVGTSSLKTVSCSDGTNGLITQGYSTFNSLPGFPLIGGAPTVNSWNSPNCGKCYQLHYKNGNVDETINMLAVDSAPGGFNLGLEAMNRLTKGNAEQLGRIHGTYTEVDKTQCGL